MKTFLARTSAGFLAALVVASPLAARQNDPAPVPVPANPQAVSQALPPADPAATTATTTTATPIAAPAKPVSDPAARLPAIPGAFPRRPATGVTAAATNVSAAPAFPQLPTANPTTGNAATPTVVRTRPAPPAPPVPGGAPAAAAGTSAASAASAASTDASAASGSDTANGDDATDVIDFKKMPLDQFLDQYAAEARRSVLRGQGLPQASIDFKAMTPLNHDERLQMFDTILALNGVTMIPTGEKAVLAVPTAQAMQEGGAFSRTTNSTDYAEASQFVTHVVQLKHVTVEEAAETVRQFAKNQNGIIGLPSTKTLVIRDYAINVKRMLEILAKIDVETPQDYELEVIPIKYGRVEDIYATMSSVIGGGGGGAGGLGASGVPGGPGMTTGRASRGGLGGSRGGRGGLGSSGGLGGYGGSRGGYGGSTGGYGGTGGYGTYSAGEFTPQQAVGTRPVTPGAATTPGINRTGQTGGLQGRYNAVNRGQGGPGSAQIEPLVTDAQITPDSRGNALIVYASKKDMAMIKKVLEKVDTLLPQVLIEGIVMNVSVGNNWNYSLTAGERPHKAGNSVIGGTANNDKNPLGSGIGFLTGALTSAATNGGINATYPASGGLGYYALLGNRWDVALNAVAGDSRVDIIQRPRIITSHAVSADFFIGSSVPYRQGGYSYGGQESFQYSQLPVGISLSVMPYITPDNLVVMEIEQQIDAIDGSFNAASGIPPQTSNKSASSTVTVRTGDVILLGGYLDNNKTKSDSGIPLLKDIPVLGNLFKSKNSSSSKQELMILVRPTILAKPQDVADYTRSQREQSGNIQELERTFQEQEDASRIKADKERAKMAKSKKKLGASAKP